MILIGCFLSTVGAGMQSLTAPFQVSTKHGEPWRAILLTLCFCEVGILIAQLESITALITQFFLMCYLSVNAACALQSLLKSPGWRPRFKYYHWSMSLLGAVLCVAVMFISHWIFALIAITIGIFVYKYIEYRGAEKEWGDGLRGLKLSAARFSLLNLEGRTPHTKNWRPQLLVFCSSNLEEVSGISHERLMAFVSQLKAGKGLTVLASVIKGNYVDSAKIAEEVRNNLRNARDRMKIKGFCEVLVAKDETEGIGSLIQTCGLGVMRHNTVIVSWPDDWRGPDVQKCHGFVDTVRMASAAKCAILVPKNVDSFPSIKEKITGYMDVWWVVHDGGMLMLLPFLLRQHRTWKNTQLRIFTVAQLEDNTVKIKEDVKTFLYHLRINAEVDVIEMTNRDISEYTYEKTLMMEQRYALLKDLRNKDKGKDIQAKVDMDRIQRKMTLCEANMEDIHNEKQKGNLCAHNDDSEVPETPDTDVTAVVDLSSSNAKPTELPTVLIEGVKAENGPNNSLMSPMMSPIRTPSPTPEPEDRDQQSTTGSGKLPYVGLKPDNVKRMHTAIKLNEMIKEKSSDAQLVIVNLPGPQKRGSDHYYMEFIEALTEGLERVLLVKGTGQEVVTIYS